MNTYIEYNMPKVVSIDQANLDGHLDQALKTIIDRRNRYIENTLTDALFNIVQSCDVAPEQARLITHRIVSYLQSNIIVDNADMRQVNK